MKDDYTTAKIGRGLKTQLNKGYDIIRISAWADEVLIDNIRELNSYLEDILRHLAMMQDDPQFEIPEKELRDLADRLILEGEKEELSEPIAEIKEIATRLEDNWLMCPICQEAWKDSCKYAMVRCPKCMNRLHNPNKAKV